MTFGIVFGLWVAADSYVGFPTQFPVVLVVAIAGVIGLAALAIRTWQRAILGFLFAVIMCALMDRFWKYAIHPTDYFKLVALVLMAATPLIVAYGAYCFWRELRRSERMTAAE